MTPREKILKRVEKLQQNLFGLEYYQPREINPIITGLLDVIEIYRGRASILPDPVDAKLRAIAEGSES